MNIIQIVPQLPPKISGVGDYALNIARQLRQDFSIETHFIVGDPNWNGSKKIEDFAVSKVSNQSSSALLTLLKQLSINKTLLHYVGYGYAKRGCPIWLIEGLEKWHSNHDNSKRLTIMFHEIYAFSWKPWTSSFWLSYSQKQLVKRLIKLSDSKITSLQEYREIITKLSSSRHNNVMTSPVFSNIGEPKYITSLAHRKPQLIVFGGRGRRTKVYQNSIEELRYACQSLNIKEIIDIGPKTGLDLYKIIDIPIKEMGELPVYDISQILSESQAGFFHYNIKRLAKSGVFASYCSHGTLPIGSYNNNLIVDGIEADKHYWTAKTGKEIFKQISSLQQIADNAYEWYQDHRLSKQGQLIASQLGIQKSQSLL